MIYIFLNFSRDNSLKNILVFKYKLFISKSFKILEKNGFTDRKNNKYCASYKAQNVWKKRSLCNVRKI